MMAEKDRSNMKGGTVGKRKAKRDKTYIKKCGRENLHTLATSAASPSAHVNSSSRNEDCSLPPQAQGHRCPTFGTVRLRPAPSGKRGPSASVPERRRLPSSGAESWRTAPSAIELERRPSLDRQQLVAQCMHSGRPACIVGDDGGALPEVSSSSCLREGEGSGPFFSHCHARVLRSTEIARDGGAAAEGSRRSRGGLVGTGPRGPGGRSLARTLVMGLAGSSRCSTSRPISVRGRYPVVGLLSRKRLDYSRVLRRPN